LVSDGSTGSGVAEACVASIRFLGSTFEAAANSASRVEADDLATFDQDVRAFVFL
jgi:hypothetical protein